MDISAQVEALINEAPPDQEMQGGIRIVAEVLGQVAAGLGHLQYYILQNFENQWQITTLEHRTQPELQKNVLYAYGHLADAARSGQDADLIAVPIQILPLLFQFFSLSQVDSLLFADEANQSDQIKELSRSDLQAVVQAALEEHLQRNDNADDEFGVIA